MLESFCNTSIAILVHDFNLKPTCQLDVWNSCNMTIAFMVKMEMFLQNLHVYWLNIKLEAKSIYPN